MSRTAASSKWYIPLFAGTELAKTSPGLVTFDPGDLLGQLPTLPCYLYEGMRLWLDGADATSIKTDNAGGVYRWDDHSGLGNNALQNTPALRPSEVAGGVDFEN